MAALVLCRYGAKVTVFEAYKEVGGRVRSNTGFSKARITEEGAELIGSFHSTLRRESTNAFRLGGVAAKFLLEGHLLQQFDAVRQRYALIELVGRLIAAQSGAEAV